MMTTMMMDSSYALLGTSYFLWFYIVVVVFYCISFYYIFIVLATCKWHAVRWPLFVGCHESDVLIMVCVWIDEVSK